MKSSWMPSQKTLCYKVKHLKLTTTKDWKKNSKVTEPCCWRNKDYFDNYCDNTIFCLWRGRKVPRWVAIRGTVVASIGAHPDDVELGMGGTLAKHSQRGDDIHIILCTLGIGGTSGDPKARENEASAAAKILNAKLHILDFPVVKLNRPSVEFERGEMPKERCWLRRGTWFPWILHRRISFCSTRFDYVMLRTAQHK